MSGVARQIQTKIQWPDLTGNEQKFFKREAKQ
jgi:hypothetical protein